MILRLFLQIKTECFCHLEHINVSCPVSGSTMDCEFIQDSLMCSVSLKRCTNLLQPQVNINVDAKRIQSGSKAGGWGLNDLGPSGAATNI